jgi:hypothetical protein
MCPPSPKHLDTPARAAAKTIIVTLMQGTE